MTELRIRPSTVTAPISTRWHAVPRVIVVAVADAEHAAAPLEAAFSIGFAVGARVVVVHVTELTRASDETVDLQSLVHAARTRTGVRLPSEELMLLGEPVASLTRFIELEGADLLVMARSLERPDDLDADTAQEGVLAAICARSSVPVLLVPAEAGDTVTVEPNCGRAI